jgi:hypothetical protein
MLSCSSQIEPVGASSQFGGTQRPAAAQQRFLHRVLLTPCVLLPNIPVALQRFFCVAIDKPSPRSALAKASSMPLLRANMALLLAIIDARAEDAAVLLGMTTLFHVKPPSADPAIFCCWIVGAVGTAAE